jgi:hypothetical protein
VAGSGEVVDVEVAEAVVGALEQELETERQATRQAIDALCRRMEVFHDESEHRRRMREVDLLLARVHAPAEVADVDDGPISLLEVLEERLAAVRAGATGLAA